MRIKTFLFLLGAIVVGSGSAQALELAVPFFHSMPSSGLVPGITHPKSSGSVGLIVKQKPMGLRKVAEQLARAAAGQ